MNISCKSFSCENKIRYNWCTNKYISVEFSRKISKTKPKLTKNFSGEYDKSWNYFPHFVLFFFLSIFLYISSQLRILIRTFWNYRSFELRGCNHWTLRASMTASCATYTSSSISLSVLCTKSLVCVLHRVIVYVLPVRWVHLENSLLLNIYGILWLSSYPL